MKQKRKEVVGKIIKADKGALFTVELESGEQLRCKPRRKLYKIRLLLGDTVTVELIDGSSLHWITYRGRKG